MSWSEKKTWWMDFVKSIILFLILGILSYLIFDKIADRRDRFNNKWEQKLTLEIDVLRDFELGYRTFRSRFDEIWKIRIEQDKKEYSISVLTDFDNAYRDVSSYSESLEFWFDTNESDLDVFIAKFKHYLNNMKKVDDMEDAIGVSSWRDDAMEGGIENFEITKEIYTEESGYGEFRDTTLLAADSLFNLILYEVKSLREL